MSPAARPGFPGCAPWSATATAATLAGSAACATTPCIPGPAALPTGPKEAAWVGAGCATVGSSIASSTTASAAGTSFPSTATDCVSLGTANAAEAEDGSATGGTAEAETASTAPVGVAAAAALDEVPEAGTFTTCCRPIKASKAAVSTKSGWGSAPCCAVAAAPPAAAGVSPAGVSVAGASALTTAPVAEEAASVASSTTVEPVSAAMAAPSSVPLAPLSPDNWARSKATNASGGRFSADNDDCADTGKLADDDTRSPTKVGIIVNVNALICITSFPVLDWYNGLSKAVLPREDSFPRPMIYCIKSLTSSLSCAPVEKRVCRRPTPHTSQRACFPHAGFSCGAG